MATQYQVVRLLRNRLYPTYQFYARMASSKTKPQDGLRLAAIITMQWLCQRLGDERPSEFDHLPDPADYRSTGDDALPSVHISNGFVVDIVSLPKSGTWSLQIIEPDLGSEPGNPKQDRAPVPGRVIETNISFRITEMQLECGFKTVVSDPSDVVIPAEVYRLSIIRQLMAHPDFGFKQVTVLGEDVLDVKTTEQYLTLMRVWHDDANQMPCVVFTYPLEKKEIPKPAFATQLTPAAISMAGKLPVLPAKTISAAIPYDTKDFAKHAATRARVYKIDPGLLTRFVEETKCRALPGDILFLEPDCFGGDIHISAYKPGTARQRQTVEDLIQRLRNYTREKDYSFGQLPFLSATRETLLRDTAAVQQEAGNMSRQWQEKVETLSEKWRSELDSRDGDIHRLSEQLQRQKQYQLQIETQKEALRTQQSNELLALRAAIEDRDAEIAYLRRKLSQPEIHTDIARWVDETFRGRLLLHQRAIELLSAKNAHIVDVKLICDALDFLATDYWDRRYGTIDTEEMNTRCSEKYGRPFEVTHIGTTTIEFTPAEYKVKYFLGAKGKPVETSLDYHLRVGRDAENLLRIYFLHDDEKKLLVIGSLPCHLRTVKFG